MEDKIGFEEYMKNYDDFIDSCAKFNFYTRSKEVQIQKTTEIDQFLMGLKKNKANAVRDGNEKIANLFFHMQCMLNAVKSALLCWINIKEMKYRESWDCLVDAQEYVFVALQISDYPGVRNIETMLQSMEKCLFPGWSYFMSPGIIETVGDCSICGKNMSECEHIEGKVYWGALCERVNTKQIAINHVAFVESPKDKRCIIEEIADEESGFMRDYFTWELTNKKNAKHGPNELLISSVALTVRSMDFK